MRKVTLCIYSYSELPVFIQEKVKSEFLRTINREFRENTVFYIASEFGIDQEQLFFIQGQIKTTNIQEHVNEAFFSALEKQYAVLVEEACIMSELNKSEYLEDGTVIKLV